MPLNDGTVVQKDVLNLIRRVRWMGWRAAFNEFADQEPVLAGYAMAASDNLGDLITTMGVPSRIRRLIENEMMVAQLVCIHAIWQSNRKLWQDFLPGTDSDEKTFEL